MSSSLIFAVIAYLLLAIVAGSLLLFPDARDWMVGAVHRLRGSSQRLARSVRQRGQSRLSSNWTDGLKQSASVVSMAREHALAIAAGVALLAMPVMIALLLRRAQPLEGFDQLGRDADPVVASVLNGEALVPPPPLPPEVFITREVEQVRPDLGAASREWALLDQSFQQRLLNVYKAMAAQGYTMALLEGYRSPERQAKLQAQGTNVTNAGAYQSYHQYGLAADSAFFRDGKLVISERDPWAMRGYQLLGVAAEAQGLRWGGRWQLQDYGHVELRKAGVLGKR